MVRVWKRWKISSSERKHSRYRNRSCISADMLAERGVIIKAVAGDITEGPCAAARNTVAMYGMNDKVEVRMGNGLSIIEPGETDVIIIAGMGAGTMIETLKLPGTLQRKPEN